MRIQQFVQADVASRRGSTQVLEVMRNPLLLLSMVIVFGTGPASARCEDVSPDIAGASDELDAADAKLNAAYHALLKALNHPAHGMAAHHARARISVIAAQRAWLKFRDADCAAVFDLADGASKTPLSMSCEAEHDLARAKQLQDMADGL